MWSARKWDEFDATLLCHEAAIISVMRVGILNKDDQLSKGTVEGIRIPLSANFPFDQLRIRPKIT